MLWVLFSLLIIFNVLDVYQTYLLMQFGATEWNPILNYLIRKFGFFEGVVGFKAIWIGILGYCIYKRK